jgi:UDP-N-acetyl-2-amino-2-deoxyglucuronate dehydrogenase
VGSGHPRPRRRAGEAIECEGNIEVIQAGVPARDTGKGGAADPKAISFVGHQRQFEDFVTALSAGRAPMVDGREGRKAVELILAIYRSARTGKTVRLPL